MAAEPWAGYAKMSEQRRKALLEFKVDEARLRWDLPSAQVVAAAVANYEALERAGDQPTKVEKAALEYVKQIQKAGAEAFGNEAGTWGHGTDDEAGGWGHG